MTDELFAPSGSRASLGQRLGNRLSGYWRFFRYEGRVVTNVALFAVVSAFLILTLIVSIFRVQPRYLVTATFADAGGVFTGQEVTYRGVNVGRIGDMRVVREGVEIDLVIERTYDRIPKEGITARVMFKSAVGEQFVDLLPSRRTGPFLQDGDDIALEDTVLPVQQEELLRLLDDVLSGISPEAIGNLVDTLGAGLGGKGEALNDALAALDPLTATLANRTDELNRLAINGDTLGSAFDASADDFVSGVKGFGRVAGALGRGAGGLERLLAAGDEYIGDVAGLVAASKRDLDLLLRNLAIVTHLSYEHLRSVADTLDWLPLLLDTIVSSYDPSTNRIRFGQLLTEVRNPPCSYGTPRRTVEAEGNAPYHPILDFGC